MRLLGHLRVSFFLCALGAVVLYGFFVALGSVSPRQVLWATAGAVVLAGIVWIHNLRVGYELADPGGDPRVRRALNRQRERRGF
jgi:hypothetical protein